MDDERKFDPVTPAAKEDIRPGFLGGHGGGDAPSGSDAGGGAGRQGGGVAEALRSAEESAADESLGGGDSLDDVRDDEELGKGFYRSKEGAAAANVLVSAVTRGKVKGVFKKGGPAVGIFLVIFMIGGILAGTQVFQPFSLIAQFQDNYNSMHMSAMLRSRVFFKKQMETGRVKNPLRGGKIFGERFSISKKQQAELKRQGIEFDDKFDFDGKEIKVLKYQDASGEEKLVVADEGLAKKMRGSGHNALGFVSAYADDPDFFRMYNSGSMTWRGQFANWFGKVTGNFISNNKLTRNMWEGWKEKKAAADGDGVKAVKDTIGSRVKKGSDIDLRVAQDELEDTDEGGTKHRTDEGKVGGGDINAKLGKIQSKFTNAANIGCAVAGVIGSINLLIAADEALQILNIITAYTEGPDKVKAGYGDDTPIHELAQTLNEKQKTVNKVLKLTGGAWPDNVSTEEVTTEGSAMMAEGVASLYSGRRGNPYDASVQSFNLTASAKTIMGGLGTSMKSFETCMAAKIGAAVISMGMDVASIITCIGTAGAGCVGLAVGAGFSVGISFAVSTLVSVITPMVASIFERDLIEELGGVNLGNALASGSLMYLGSVHRANGGSLGTGDEYEQFAVARQQVLAEKAKEERESLSPFDITSNNTFMGKIMTQMMTLANSDSLMSVVSSVSSATSASVVALTPSASAVAANIAKTMPSIEEYGETCPYLASIGAVGDIYCNPYTLTDTSTMEDDPADVIDKIALMTDDDDEHKNFEGESGDEDIRINKKSDLAKYIKYCDNRTSAFGAADYNIAGEINNATTIETGVTWGDTAANSFIGSIPVVGDGIDMIESEKNLRNIGYITGESCVAGNELQEATLPNVSENILHAVVGIIPTTVSAIRNGGQVADNSTSPNWERAKYYQRFIEDQSLAESMGLIEESAVSVFLREYYEENPIDTSYEGMLARYSGLTKDMVADVLDLIDCYNFIAQYDPSERYAFGGDGVEIDEGRALFENENVLAGGAVLPENIVYADVRNRNYVV